jgi:hypothetical protein
MARSIQACRHARATDGSELEEVLGTAYLHKSEMENGVYRDPGDCCLFPPRRVFRYTKTADSEKACITFLNFSKRSRTR